MASDYGDEAGEKLFDWMLRMGQDASQDAIRASAERLKNAIRNLRGQIDEPLAEAEHESVRDYARLNLSEFEELPDYASLQVWRILLLVAGLGCWICPLVRRKEPFVGGLELGLVSVLAGEIIGRGLFYGLHMTVGMAVAG